MNNFIVGSVVGIEGSIIRVLMKEQSNLESYQNDGEIYNGVCIGTYLGIIRGSNKLIVRVEKEVLEDTNENYNSQDYKKNRFERILEVRLIGNLVGEGNEKKFEMGIKIFPMIYNDVILLSDDEIRLIIQKGYKEDENVICIGNSVFNDIKINLPWYNLFNTHIGIFGNTGSGKSNTLAKLYTELFNLQNEKINLLGISNFFVLDFNGEYIANNILCNNSIKLKKDLSISTTEEAGEKDVIGDKIRMSPNEFWDADTLSILYSATEKTQKPFLSSVINYAKKLTKEGEAFDITEKLIKKELINSFRTLFEKNNRKETLELFLDILKIVYSEDTINNIKENVPILTSSWHSKSETYYFNGKYLDSCKYEVQGNFEKLNSFFCENNFGNLTITNKLYILSLNKLINDLCMGYSQYEYIQYLLTRIEAKSGFIDDVIEVSSKAEEWNIVNVISMRNCNQEIKKMIPLLLVKQLYEKQKEKINSKSTISNTVHIIIDEAHNILSEQSNREANAWKDYRLEVFEEIIKEGRKFGFYITLSSQRPSDISSTIISQLHNFFIHRLVNDQDLKMIDNTISSLDRVSKSSIPTLSAGQCIISGTSFELPIAVMVDMLGDGERPQSDNADLKEIWKKG